MTNSKHKTAITRNKPSVPMRYLARKNLLTGNKLDFGSGKGFDANYFAMDKFDTFYSPAYPQKRYDTITCNYVLNVCFTKEIKAILNTIKSLLNQSGIAYITVRRDIIKPGFTSKGTYQKNVILDLPVLKETNSYCTYILTLNNRERKQPTLLTTKEEKL